MTASLPCSGMITINQGMGVIIGNVLFKEGIDRRGPFGKASIESLAISLLDQGSGANTPWPGRLNPCRIWFELERLDFDKEEWF